MDTRDPVPAPPPGIVPLLRRLAAEAVGTGLLATAVVGPGIAAARLSPTDVGLQLAENAAATGAALAVIILLVGPVSGAHLNPLVSLADWWLGRPHHPGSRAGLTLPEVGAYTLAQTAGGIAGAVLANLMFDLPAVTWSTTRRTGGNLWLSEAVATAGLVAVVFALARSGRAALSAATVGAYIAAAYWFTSSTSFANPAVTVARAFTDTFAGIAPASIAGFALAQAVGTAIAAVGTRLLYPDPSASAAVVVAPHTDRPAAPARLTAGSRDRRP